MTVNELLGRVDSRELSEWRAFYDLEPFGFDAEIYGHAMNAAHIINSRRAKGQKAVKVDDLMPKRKQTQTIDQVISFAATMTKAMGGEDKRGKK